MFYFFISYKVVGKNSRALDKYSSNESSEIEFIRIKELFIKKADY